MAERKPISKKMRFEVFKRDNFTCQYCERHAPDVVLECDHIKPVAEGGKNTFLNLITSCMECNRGKGKTVLSDSSAVDKQFERMAVLNEKREQMKMMLKWREELEKFESEQIEAIERIMLPPDKQLTDWAYKKIRSLIKEFGFDEVCTAAQIAYDRYILGYKENFSFAFGKLGGICYNRKHNRGGK